MRRLFILLAVLVALTMAGVGSAQAVTSDFTVRSTGVFVSTASANITGTAICDDPSGTGTLTFSTVVGTPYTVTGSTPVVCDGVRHDWAATITGGPWSQGQAITLRGTLVAGSGTVSKIYKVLLA